MKKGGNITKNRSVLIAAFLTIATFGMSSQGYTKETFREMIVVLRLFQNV